MNKTQRTLLAEAQRNPLGLVTVSHGCISSRKKGHYGVRRHDAACLLRDRGLLRVIHAERHARPLSHGHGQERYAVVTFELTDTGRTTSLEG